MIAPAPRAISVAGLAGQILLPSDPGAAARISTALRAALPHWPLSEVPGRQADMRWQIRAATADTWLWLDAEGRSRDGALSAASLACAVAADLSSAFCTAAPERIGLHAAALELDGALLILLGRARSGKSTLASELALRAPTRFFCDDVLPLTPDGAGVALGVAPRLRLGAQALSPALAQACEAHLALCDARYGWLALPDQAPFGTQAPARALIRIERHPGAAARLVPLPKSEAIAELLRASLVEFPDPETALHRLGALAEAAPAWRLICSDPSEGAALLHAHFRSRSPAPAAAAPPAVTNHRPTGPRVRASQPWQRHPAARLHEAEGGGFLWREGHQRLFALSPRALELWQLLQWPASVDELARDLSRAVPEWDRRRLRRDLRAHFGALAGAGLILPAPQG